MVARMGHWFKGEFFDLLYNSLYTSLCFFSPKSVEMVDVEDKVLKVCYYLYLWFSVPVKTNGKWLPVENVFSSLQDIWHLAERWKKDLCDDLTKECWKLEPDFEHSYNRIGPVAEDNRVSYLTGTTRFINFYGRIISHFKYHYSTDHCHQWFLEPSDI